ncbi:MAG: hypothetical protein ACRBFS_11255 [Aureispira sp.]
MSDLLDDEQAEQLEEEQLEQVRALALVFFAKCLADLYFRLNMEFFYFDVNYVLWGIIVLQAIVIQRSLYAFYSWKDKWLLYYLRFFYVSLGLLFLTIAIMYSDWNWMQENMYPYYIHGLVLLLLDTAVSLLLIRYYFNQGKGGQYWLFMENLIKLSFVILLIYKSVFLQLVLFLSPHIVLIGGGVKVLLAVCSIGYWVMILNKIPSKQRIFSFISLLAVLSWKLGIYLEYYVHSNLELVLFASVVLAVLAYAFSFNEDTKEESRNPIE